MNLNEEIEAALREAGLTHLQALRLALELVEQSDAGRLRGERRMNRCRCVIRMGAEQRRAAEHTANFGNAVESALRTRSERRPRTQKEFAGICRRMLRERPLLARRSVCGISAAECSELLQGVFPTPRQRRKARAILHGIFAHAICKGWCAENPVQKVPPPSLEEHEIIPLTLLQIKRLLAIARLPQHRACMPALGVMLWCGVRPAEVTRLEWGDWDREEDVIVLRPRHSKTGGWRHVHVRPVLRAWLNDYGEPGSGPLCPPDWGRRWKRLRDGAGLIPWQQDVLRHTFASYHAKQFRNFSLLQEEMGHRSSALLRTRYLSMRGVTTEGAQLFWKPRGIWSR